VNADSLVATGPSQRKAVLRGGTEISICRRYDGVSAFRSGIDGGPM